MAQLTGNTVASTYESLIKTADNTTINASTTEALSDGAGNPLPLKVSQTTIEFTGNVVGISTSDLTNDSGFITITDVNTATSSLSASLALDIAANLAAIESNDADILGLDNQVSLLQSTASFLVDSASLALYDATSDFSTLTFTKGDNTTFEVDTTPRQVIEGVKNREAVTLPKGTPVYVSGSTGNLSDVYKADAGSADKIPASYVLLQELTADEEGFGLAMGFINGVDTSAFQAGDSIYLAVGGGYTNVVPTGSAFIQRLGNVIKNDVNGSGIFTGAGSVRGLPNLTENYLWVGDADDVPKLVLSSSIVPTTSLTASYVAGANVDGAVGLSTLAVNALNATNADNVDIDNVSADVVYGFVFRDGDSSTYQQLYADTQADTPGWNPSTNTITAPIISASTAFHGDLDGNALTATTASYALTASYVADLPAQFSEITNYTGTTLTLGDGNYSSYLGKTIVMTNASTIDFELDFTSAPQIGDEIYAVQGGAGTINIINYGGALNSSVGTSPAPRAQWSGMVFKYLGSGDWLVMGDIE